MVSNKTSMASVSI